MSPAYRKSVWTVVAVVAVGCVLQLVTGGVDFRLFSWPVSLILVALLLLGITASAMFRKSAFFNWVSGLPLSVVVLVAWMLLCVSIGLVHDDTFPSARHTACSWPVILIYFLLLLSLGCVVVRRFVSRGWKDIGFLMNHIGLWLILVGVGIGATDYRTYVVKIHEGETLDYVTADNGLRIKLPYRLTLDDFIMEQHPVKWGVVDVRTGKFQPEKSPVFYDTEKDAFDSGRADDKHLLVASTLPEPSRFASVLTIESDGERQPITVEVNHPYRKGKTALFQYGYDVEAGSESAFSILQVVYDPWLPVVYVGIVMLGIGAVTMFGGKKRNKGTRYDVE